MDNPRQQQQQQRKLFAIAENIPVNTFSTEIEIGSLSLFINMKIKKCAVVSHTSSSFLTVSGRRRHQLTSSYSEMTEMK